MDESINKILSSTGYCALASANQDGSPWNVPITFAFNKTHIFFRSLAGTVHGKNIDNNKKVSVVVFDTTQKVSGALYINSFARKLSGKDKTQATQALNSRFNISGNQWKEADYYSVEIGKSNKAKSTGQQFYFDAEVQL